MDREELDMRIAAVEHALACAEMIDHEGRRRVEVEYYRHELDLLLEMADPINLAGSGPVPIEPREG